MRQLAAWFALSNRDRGLLLEAFVTLAFFRFALHAFALERLHRWAGALCAGKGPLDRIVWAARTAARWLPGTTCLCAALALQRMLGRRGYTSELHIGVARGQQGFSAHAWIVRDGQVLIGEQGEESYTRLAIWRAGASAGAGRETPPG